MTMTWNLVTFSDELFEKKQQFLTSHAKALGLNSNEYSYEWLQGEDFFIENKNLFDDSVAKGFFSWKPYILLDALNKSNEGDIIFYCDTNDLFHPELIPYVESIINDDFCLLVLGGGTNKDWTKRDCFVFMDCDEEDYWNSKQLEAGISFWKVCDESKKIVSEWLMYCKDRRIISDDNNISDKENFPSFKEHRRDQSILTNLAIKYGLSVADSQIRNFVECNCDYWYDRNKTNNFNLGRPIDKLLLQLNGEYPHA